MPASPPWRYVWLAASTGVRRSELCGMQICDIDLDNGWLHVAFNYVVKGARRSGRTPRLIRTGILRSTR